MPVLSKKKAGEKYLTNAERAAQRNATRNASTAAKKALNRAYAKSKKANSTGAKGTIARAREGFARQEERKLNNANEGGGRRGTRRRRD
jgi:hypothetical protein